jgi:hypothetical protein
MRWAFSHDRNRGWNPCTWPQSSASSP